MARLHLLDHRIRAGRYPNCTSLARELEVSPRTVQRDIELLRDRLGAPLEYDRRRRGYFYTSPDFRLPASPLTQQEMAGLHLAARLVSLVAGSIFEEPVQQLLAKLTAALPDGVSIAAQASSAVSLGLPPLRGDETQVVAALDLLQEAMLTRCTVRLRYYSAYRDAWSQRRLDPYHLHYRDGAWYAIGWCHWRKDLRTFAVDRMRELQLLARNFHMPHFNAAAYLQTAWSIETGQPVEVLIRFAPEQARYIRERPWHTTQQLAEEPGGYLLLRVVVGGLAEMARWVLQFGGGAEVLAPLALRQMVAKEVQRLTTIYTAQP